MPDLLLLRHLAPKAFRGVRIYLWLLFWLTFFVLASGLIIGVFSGPDTVHNDRDHAPKTRQNGKA